ncbi:hypothetical protein GCM10022222_82220 [Amycolatopsis ultiminotia]|uniref:IclR-ED domain-containing protein n=1 Tax=Amycolatopsis ultiminotia TaxID=543629 RepID=A0ABP6YM02_9PSEU
MWVAAARSRHSVRFVPTLYAWLPSYAGASASAILAHRPDPERRRRYERTLEPFTKTTIIVPAELVLAKIRTAGYSISEDEVNLGATAVARLQNRRPRSQPAHANDNLATISNTQIPLYEQGEMSKGVGVLARKPVRRGNRQRSRGRVRCCRPREFSRGRRDELDGSVQGRWRAGSSGARRHCRRRAW